MMLLNCGVLLLSAVVGTLPSHGSVGSVRQGLHGKPAVIYGAGQIEAYLSAEDVAYIRPGFNIKLVNLSNVAAGKKPVVEITYADDLDQPLDYLGKATPGPLSISFILAWYDGGKRQYTSYTTRVRSGVTQPSPTRTASGPHSSSATRATSSAPHCRRRSTSPRPRRSASMAGARPPRSSARITTPTTSTTTSAPTARR